MKITEEFSNYSLQDTVQAELNNNLTIVNAMMGERYLKAKPEFYILGGAALIFHNLNYMSTLDIDTANRIEESIREEVSCFISDMASEVSVLPYHYKDRALKIRRDLKYIDVYVLSKEDLVLSKLYPARRKDLKTILSTGILNQSDLTLIKQILYTEFQKTHRDRIIKNAKYVGLELGEL